MKMITPVRGEFDVQTELTKTKLSIKDVEFFIGPDFLCLILLSDDYLLVSDGWKDYDNNPINKNATAIVGEPIYGSVILLEPDEFDFHKFRNQGGLQAIKHRAP